MTDRSSRPNNSPARLDTRTERRIIGLRANRRWGPHRISYHLGIPRSTVGRVLDRYRMPLLAHLDQATGLRVRKAKIIRYEKSAPGELVHIDIKKLGRIPDGCGHRVLGRKAGARNNKRLGRGYAYLHHAVDDHSRLAYSEILDNERKETAASFWARAHKFFVDAGIEVTAVMTDNGACYRSGAFAASLDGIKHRRTRPYRPQTNGKVERLNRTLAAEWDCASVPAMDWTYQSEKLSALGKCLDLYQGGTANGTVAHLWDCANVPSQQWTRTAQSQYYNPASGKCLDVVGSGTANGTRAHLWECHPGATQKWTLPR